MRLFAALLLLTTALPAYAEECSSWKAEMEETEGAARMTARVCAPTASQPSELMFQCGRPGMLSIRYIPGDGDDYPPSGNMNFKTGLVASFVRHAQAHRLMFVFEAMDGAMVSEVKTDDMMLEAVKADIAIKLTDPSQKIPPATFMLKGSRKALEQLEASCASQAPAEED